MRGARGEGVEESGKRERRGLSEKGFWEKELWDRFVGECICVWRRREEEERGG